MSQKILCMVILVAGLAAVVKADIIGDLLGFDLVGALTGESQEKNSNVKGQRDEEEEEEGSSTCDCEGNGCNCCVDFNLTTIIDLGGPGCVKMRYLSQDEGVALNVSYGDSLLHSQVVKQKDKKGSCMDLLSELAQICAKFDKLKATDNGLEGCLHFEPHVLGEVTSKYHIGCFKMGPEGMVQDESLTKNGEKPQEEEEAVNEDDKNKPGDAENEEDDDDDAGSSILDVVNHSAEQGLSFFSDLLGIKVPGKKNKSTTEKPKEEVTEAAAEESEESQEEESRNSKSYSGRLGRLTANHLH